MAGDAETGMMIMKMDKGLDTGPVALTERVAIAADMTGGELHDKMMQVGGRLMRQAMGKLEADDLPLTPQADEGVIYAQKISKAETEIDFSQPAETVHNHIRGLAPFPGAWFEVAINGKPERIKVLGSTLGEGHGAAGTVLSDTLDIACGSGAVRLTRLQKAGGKALAAEDFRRGTALPVGTVIARSAG